MMEIMKEMCIRQGYVPKNCKLDGQIIWGLINLSEDPCSGCNENRGVCGGRPSDPDYMDKKLAKGKGSEN